MSIRCFVYDELTDCQKTNCIHRCDAFGSHCMTLYKNVSGQMINAAASCMPIADGFCLDHPISDTECRLRYRNQMANQDHFSCCCTGDLCNANIVKNKTLLQHRPPTTTTTTLQSIISPTRSNSDKMMYYSVPPVICTFVILLVVVLLWKKHKRTMNRQRPLNNASPPTPLATRPVQWDTIISHGQFGCVWRATWEGNDAAIKIIQAHEKASWITEKAMYQNYSLFHDNILKFYSGEKRLGEDGMIQFWIVTQYHPNGSLNDYLRQNLLDWSLMLRMMISMVKGLAFLHAENVRLTPIKPVIAHRDFKSRNILVKNNLQCCLSDFGSACQFSDIKDNDDIKAQVGTRRYMAPEVLDGAIAFQADAFLNIDIYALGLVMWELLSRCTTDTVIVDSHYRTPYELEVGVHPTLDEMRSCVVENKYRPKLKEEWKTSPEMSEICNTIEECWDTEPDARLHAECVLARLNNIDLALFQDGNDSDASSGFIESSFISDQMVDMSSDVDISNKQPLLVNISKKSDMELSGDDLERNKDSYIVELSSDQGVEFSTETVETELSTREPLIGSV